MDNNLRADDEQAAVRAIIGAQITGLDWKWLTDRLAEVPTLTDVVSAHEPNPSAVELRRAWQDGTLLEAARGVLRSCRQQGVCVLHWDSGNYPVGLRSLYRPPLVLYVQGGSGTPPFSWDAPSLAIVGSRKADNSGFRIAQRLAEELAASGVRVVSGLAVGIDAAAHDGALSSGKSGATIAVFGHGLAHCYPKQNERLRDRILAHGGVLMSEYPPLQPPLPQQFIARNRIIAGLSRAVVVVQATAKSGSLATARFGLDQGKEILVLPGSVDDPRYEGSNRLIREGATMVTSAQDVLEVFPDIQPIVRDKSEDTKDFDLGGGARRLAGLLAEHGQAPYEMLLKMWDEAGDGPLQVCLVELEIAGIIDRLPGNQFALAGKSRPARLA